MEEHITTSFDGTRIFWKTTGKGPTICACNGIGVSTFFWKYVAEYFQKTNKVVLWDYRSHGRSDPAPDYDNLTMATNARDLKAVLDAAGVDKAVLMGHSMGVQTIFEFYRLFPERTAALIPVLGSYGRPMDTFLGTDLVRKAFPFVYHLVYLFPGLTNKVTQTAMRGLFHHRISFPGAHLIGFLNGKFMKKEELGPYLDHLRTLDLRAFLGMARRMQENSAKDLLPNIGVPCLIISGENDLFTPWEISKEMQKRIPNAEMLTIPCGSHAALVEQPELMNLRIDKFINERLKNSSWKKKPVKVVKAGKKSGSKKKAANA